MKIVDLVEGAKIAKEKRIEKQKTKALNHNADLTYVYAENVFNKFKAAYAIQEKKGKHCCKIHFNPYPNSEVMRKVFQKVSKKEYLDKFKSILCEMLEDENFKDYVFSSSILNVKEPITLTVKW